MAKIVNLYNKNQRKTNYDNKEMHDPKHNTMTHSKKPSRLNHGKNLLTKNDDSSNNQVKWEVFYHFVTGASSGNELRCILQRLWNIKSLSQPRVEEIKLEVNSLAKQISNILSKATRKKTLIVIDSIDEVNYWLMTD